MSMTDADRAALLARHRARMAEPGYAEVMARSDVEWDRIQAEMRAEHPDVLRRAAAILTERSSRPKSLTLRVLVLVLTRSADRIERTEAG